MVFIPTNVKVSEVALAGTAIEYRPAASVSMPSVVPLTVTDTLGMGMPSSADVTVPVIVTV